MKIDCAYDELIPVSNLIENPDNTNEHTEEQVKRLSEIIAFQGQRSPIVVSKRSGFIVVGHCRLRAIKLLGWEKCAVNYQNFESEAQEYAHMNADNAIATWAEINLAKVNAKIPELGPELNLDMLGLKDFKLDVSELEINEKEVDENIKTEHTCPSCGYVW